MLKGLRITETGTDLECGFYHIVFENGKTLQACLFVNDRGDYTPAIESDDCGFDWGTSGETNRWAFTEDGDSSEALAFLLKQAKIDGIEII